MLMIVRNTLDALIPMVLHCSAFDTEEEIIVFTHYMGFMMKKISEGKIQTDLDFELALIEYTDMIANTEL